MLWQYKTAGIEIGIEFFAQFYMYYQIHKLCAIGFIPYYYRYDGNSVQGHETSPVGETSSSTGKSTTSIPICKYYLPFYIVNKHVTCAIKV